MKQSVRRGLWWGRAAEPGSGDGVGTNDHATLRSEKQTRTAENRRSPPGMGYQLYLAADPQRHARQAASTRIPRGH